ncbi:radical SAM protein [Candidatus Woesearchaeota archaeon]|nr:radical SAM protein [Candidatus Woesearchaeota archaeon]HIH38088.1 radical SAM protein [Candidatus Woesearchaeota archaeon]HIJ03179.1 radical SAM protein [Candidatus Woesearchaeota archaeon]
MELKSRPKGDIFLPDGEFQSIEKRLSQAADDTRIVIFQSFDYRTRVGPFLFADVKLIPLGPRAIASALSAAGFSHVRVVLQQWTPNVRPSTTLLDGEPPEVVLISGMQIHSKEMYALLGDAWTMKERPLLIAGGAKAIYEPAHFFLKKKPQADIVVQGEEYILLELMELLMNVREEGEHLRETFNRVNEEGGLHHILGIMFFHKGKLVNTGTQRLLSNLEELPSPLLGLSLLEPKHKKKTLSPSPLPLNRVSRFGRVLSLITSHGCVETCSYCPIPAYNQRKIRTKSAKALADEIKQLVEETGITTFFGTDDSAFVNKVWLRELTDVLVETKIEKGRHAGRSVGSVISYATEGTLRSIVHDKGILPKMRSAGFKAIWFGIEDLNAELVSKGQSAEKTKEAFLALRAAGISPRPMMIHYDEQPWTRNDGKYGLKETVEYLRDECKATSIQITYITPSIGSRAYDQHYLHGEVLKKVGKMEVEDYLFDGNHVVATKHSSPYSKQQELLKGYRLFYSPKELIKRLFWKKDGVKRMDILNQFGGMIGYLKSRLTMKPWLKDLKTAKLERWDSLPVFSDYTLIDLHDNTVIESISAHNDAITIIIEKNAVLDKIESLKKEFYSIVEGIKAIELTYPKLGDLKEIALARLAELNKVVSEFTKEHYLLLCERIKEFVQSVREIIMHIRNQNIELITTTPSI